MKEGTQSGLGEENSSSRKIRPLSGLSGIREELQRDSDWPAETRITPRRIKDQKGQAEHSLFNTEATCWNCLGLGELGGERAGEVGDAW